MDWEKQYDKAKPWIGFYFLIVILILIIALASEFTWALAAFFVAYIGLIGFIIILTIFKLGIELENTTVHQIGLTTSLQNLVRLVSENNDAKINAAYRKGYLEGYDAARKNYGDKHDRQRRRKGNPGKK